MSEIKEFTFFELVGLFRRYSKMTLKLALEYKLDRFLTAFAIFCREMISISVMYLLFVRFVRIKGWEMNEMFFLYSFLFLSYSLFVFFFTGIREFDRLVYTGQLDRFLLRPIGILFQVIAERVDYPATIGHGAVGIILFLSAANSVGIDWNAINIIYYIMALIGGAIIQASLFMISSCLCFWAIRTINLRNMIFFNARRFAGYPITFYPVFLQKLLIYVLPFAFVNYFPAMYFLRKPELANFWGGYLYLTPLVGAVMFYLVYQLWERGIKSYSSTGVEMQ